MTITRVAQLSAEDRTMSPILHFDIANHFTISSAQAKTGTYSYLKDSSTNFGQMMGKSTPSVSAYRTGFWFRHAGLGTASSVGLYRLMAGSTPYESATIGIIINNVDGELQIVRPASGTSNNITSIHDEAIPASLSAQNTWVHVGITHKIAEIDGFISVYIDGVKVVEYTGDTRLFGQGSGSNFYELGATSLFVGGGNFYHGMIGHNVSSPAYVDDWFIDTYVGESDAPVPARRFLAALPDGAGEDAEWTPLSSTNVSQVDDNPNDGDSTYNKALSAGLRDTFTYSDIVLPADHQIVAVIPSPFARRLDTELDHQISVHAWDGLQYGDSSDLELTMSYDSPVFERLTTQPDSSNWNEADFNAMQFGYRSRGTF